MRPAEVLEDEDADPVGDDGAVGAAVVEVEDEDGADDADAGHAHDDGEVDADERHRLARFRHLLRHREHEDAERQHHRHTQRDLLTCTLSSLPPPPVSSRRGDPSRVEGRRRAA